MANTNNLLIWSDDEVGLLLHISLDYKCDKLQKGIDWETCKSKYVDITGLFEEQYPIYSTGKNFPHNKDSLLYFIAKGQVTTKLKQVKRNYRRAVYAGRRSANGHVVFIYFKLCEQLWGGSPDTQGNDTGIETDDLEIAESDIERSDLPPGVVKQRLDLLQARLNSHRGEQRSVSNYRQMSSSDFRLRFFKIKVPY